MARAAAGLKDLLTSRRSFVCWGGSHINIIFASISGAPWGRSLIMIVGSFEKTLWLRLTARTLSCRVIAQ
jgi:hypothetical protein